MQEFVNNIEYRKAFKEVYEILKYVSDEVLEKVPSEVMNVIQENMQSDYEYKVDIANFKEQEMSEIAKAILSMIYTEYWASEEEKQRIKIQENNERNKIEEEKRLRYNPDNIFKKSEENINNSECVELVKYKESIFKRIINLFKRN